MEAVDALPYLAETEATLLMTTTREDEIGMDIKRELNTLVYPENGNLCDRCRQHPWSGLRMAVIGPGPFRGNFMAEEYSIEVPGQQPSVSYIRFDDTYLDESAAFYDAFTGLFAASDPSDELDSDDYLNLTVKIDSNQADS